MLPFFFFFYLRRGKADSYKIGQKSDINISLVRSEYCTLFCYTLKTAGEEYYHAKVELQSNVAEEYYHARIDMSIVTKT